MIHGTCLALGDVCAILRGHSGAGKSDLALRFLFLPSEHLGARPALIADDQVILRRSGERIRASCPSALKGLIEVRGVGISRAPSIRDEAELSLLVDLDRTGQAQRLPTFDERETLMALAIRRVALDPFEHSAPIKLALMLRNLPETTVD